MKPKRAVKQLERQLRSDPDNLVLRVKLASALREVGRGDDAAALYRSVAGAYQRQGRLAQGIAVLRSALEVQPGDPRTLDLLEALERARSADQRYARTAAPADAIPSGPLRPPAPAGSGWEPARPSPHAGGMDAESRPPGVPDRRVSRPLTVPSLVHGSNRLTPTPVSRPSDPRRRSSSSMPPAELAIVDLPDDPSEDEKTVLHDPAAGDPFDDAATRVAGAGELVSRLRAGEGDLDERVTRPTVQFPSEEATIARPTPQRRPASPAPRQREARDTTRDPEWSRPERAATDPLEKTHVFNRSYSEVLGALAPDGTAIEVPLGVFSELSEEVLARLARGMVMRRFEPAEVVVHEGEPGDACYVIATGEVRVLKRDSGEANAAYIEVARLGRGSVFGEFALLADRRRHATVQAVTACELFEIPRQLVHELAESFPEVGPTLERFYRERLLATLLATAPLFQPLPAERRADLLARFRPERSAPGQQIISEGEPGGGLYLIVLGKVEITKSVPGGRSVLLATLGEGAYFGEMSLLQGGVASASVIAEGPTELAVLPAQDFYQVVAEYPVLWEAMRREAGRRELEIHKIVAGDTGVV